MKKVGFRSLLLKLTLIISFTKKTLHLAPYKDPQVTKTVSFQLKDAVQAINGTQIFVRRDLDDGSRVIYLYDVLAPDFSDPNASPIDTYSLQMDRNRLRKFVTHYSDPDTLFISDRRLFVFSLSQKAVVSFGEKVGALFALEHLNGTNLVFIGGATHIMLRYDYTDDPLDPLAKSETLATAVLRRVHPLEGIKGTEITWSGGEGKLFFVDRTGPMTSALRTYIPPSGNGLNFLYTFKTPKKLVVWFHWDDGG